MTIGDGAEGLNCPVRETCVAETPVRFGRTRRIYLRQMRRALRTALLVFCGSSVSSPTQSNVAASAFGHAGFESDAGCGGSR